MSTDPFFADLPPEEPKKSTDSSDVFFADLSAEKPKPKKSWGELFERGTKQSISRMLLDASMDPFFSDLPPEKTAPTEDEGFWGNLVQMAGEFSGDLPYYMAGGTLGARLGFAVPGTPYTKGAAATLGGGAGALALPTFLKQALREYKDYQTKGGNYTFGEWLEAADRVASETLKSGLSGVLLGQISKAIPMLEGLPGIGKLFTTKYVAPVAKRAVETAGLTAVGAAAEGKMPTAEDLATNALMVLGFHAPELPRIVLRKIGERILKSNLSPEEFAKMEKAWIAEQISKTARKAIPAYEELKTPRELEGVKEEGKETGLKFPEEKVLETGPKYQPLKIDYAPATEPTELHGNLEWYHNIYELPSFSKSEYKLWRRMWDKYLSPDLFEIIYNPEEKKDITNLRADYKNTKPVSNDPLANDKALQHEPSIRGKYLGTLGDFIKGEAARKLLEPVLDTPVYLKREGDVYINPTGKGGHTFYGEKGVKNFGLDPNIHWIELNPNYAPISILRTLLHEGKHAFDWKAGPGEFEKRTEAYKLDPNLNYAIYPHEIDAREFARQATKDIEAYRQTVEKTREKGAIKKPSAIEKRLPTTRPTEKGAEPEEMKFGKEGRKIEVVSAQEAKEPKRGKKTVRESIEFGTPSKPKKSPSYKGFYSKIIDRFFPLKKYVEGSKLDLRPSENPYILARLFQGYMGKVDTALMYKTFDPLTMKWTGEGLSPILKDVKGDLEGFSAYLTAKRALEVEAQGKSTGIDLDNARAEVERGKAKFEGAAKRLYEYQDRILDYAERQGLISKDLIDSWREIYQNYVPLKRVVEEGNEVYFTKSLQPKSPFYKMEGSERQIIDPLQSVVENTYLIMRAADQNAVIRSLVNVSKAKEENLLQGVAKKMDEGTLTIGDVLEAMRESNISDDGTVKYFENGKAKTYKLPEEVADAVKGLKTQEFGMLQKFVSYPTRLVRMGAITFSPGTLIKLALIDQLEAYLYTDVGYIPFIDLAKGFYKAIKKPDIYWQWKASGGDQALSREMSRAKKQLAVKKIANDKMLIKGPDDFLRATEEISRPLEEATRISVFEKALKRSGMTPDDLRSAALMSREATLDFARQGAKTQLANQAIPFFNASIQGADMFMRKVKENPKIIPKAIATVTLPTLGLYWLNKDRKEFQELPDWERNGYWHFYVTIPGKEKPLHFKLARPFELGAVFATAPERLAEYAYKRDPDSLKEIGKNVWDVFTPSFIPAILDPIIAAKANKDLFTGKPIVPARLQKLAAKEQIGPYTSEFAKKAGALISHIPFIGDSQAASPVMIDHMISSWTGGAGSKLLQLTESALRKSGIGPAKVEPEKELADWPVLKQFIGREGYTSQAKSIQQFYDKLDEMDKTHAAMMLAKKEHRIEDYYRLRKDIDIGKYNRGVNLRKVLGKHFAAIRNIQIDAEHYNPAEKKILIDQLVADMVGATRGYLGKD